MAITATGAGTAAIGAGITAAGTAAITGKLATSRGPDGDRRWRSPFRFWKRFGSAAVETSQLPKKGRAGFRRAATLQRE